jgi:hypothetical protein
MDDTKIADLRDRYEAARAAKETADRAAAEAARMAAEAKLELLDAENSPGPEWERAWIRAWLLGDHRACDRLLALRYPEEHMEELERAQEIAREIQAGAGLC